MEKTSVKANTSSKSLVESVISQAKKPNFIWRERQAATYSQPNKKVVDESLGERRNPINLDDQR